MEDKTKNAEDTQTNSEEIHRNNEDTTTKSETKNEHKEL